MNRESIALAAESQWVGSIMVRTANFDIGYDEQEMRIRIGRILIALPISLPDDLGIEQTFRIRS